MARADYLDQEMLDIDNTVQKINAAILTLKEYRAALITNAVTGKIDVRDLKLPEPELEKSA